MTTRIKASDVGGVDTGGNRPVERLARTASANSATQPNAGTPTESYTITDTAHRLAALQESIAAMPEVDAARVTTVRTAIEKGQYTTSPEKIADRLLQLEGDLAAATQRRQV